MAADESLGLLGQFQQGSSGGGDVFNIATYLIVSMTVLVGIAYLLSKALNNRKLEDWAKNEFLQVLISAAMVGGIFLLMAPGTGIIILAFQSLVPEHLPVPILAVDPDFPVIAAACVGDMAGAKIICFAYQYLGWLSDIIVSLATNLLMINTFLDILSKIAIDVVVVEVTPLSGLSSVVQVLNSILQSLMFLGIVVEVERALLVFISKTAMQIFLPIGVVLRTFFATRKVGGTLMALAVGLYLVFPLAIALNATAVDEANTQSMENLTALYESAQKLSPTTAFTEPGSIVDTKAWTAYLDNFGASAKNLIDTIGSIPDMMITIMSSLVVQIVFLPLLSVMITIIAIKELASIFGGEVNLSRFEV